MGEPQRYHLVMRLPLAVLLMCLALYFWSHYYTSVPYTVAAAVLLAVGLYSSYLAFTSLICGVWTFHRRNICCEKIYYILCMCFLRENDCMAATEGGTYICPCWKRCCKDDGFPETEEEEAIVGGMYDSGSNYHSNPYIVPDFTLCHEDVNGVVTWPDVPPEGAGVPPPYSEGGPPSYEEAIKEQQQQSNTATVTVDRI